MKKLIFDKETYFIGPAKRNLGNKGYIPIETAYYKKVFELAQVQELNILISATSRYKLFCNGEVVANGPCKSDPRQYYCDKIDITKYLKVGKNIIGVKVVSYPPTEAMVEENKGPYSVIGTAAGPCLFLNTKNSGININTGESEWYVCHDEAIAWVPEKETMMGCSEDVNGELLRKNFTDSISLEGFEKAERKWTNKVSVVGALPIYPLYERPIPMLDLGEPQTFLRVLPKVKSGHTPIVFENGCNILQANKKYSLDIDAGQLITGYFRLKVNGGKGSAISITYAESYSNNPDVTGFSAQKGIRDDYKNFDIVGYTDIYRPGGGVEEYEPFWFRTFRFIRIVIKTGDESMVLYEPTYCETGYPLRPKTIIDPKQDWVNKIWDMSLRTLHRCMHESYEDCPYYEQMQYGLDTRLQILFTYALGGDRKLAIKTFDDFHLSLLPEGILQSRYPSKVPQVIPTFPLFWINMLMDYYEETGDLEIIKKYRCTIESVLDWFLKKRNKDGLIENLGYWEYVDWAPEWEDTIGEPSAVREGPSTIENLIYAYALGLASKMMELIDFNDLASNYFRARTEILVTIEKRCYNHEIGLYREGPDFEEYSQHSQVWAVMNGLVEGENARALMLKTIEQKDLIQCTFPLFFYLFRSLEKVGLYEKTQDLWEEWWKPLLLKSLSTIPEIPRDTTRSDCHAWGSLMLYEYPRTILGVYPKEPGFKVIGIKPRGLFLGSAKGQVHTLVGKVYVSWEIYKNIFSIEVDIPVGAEAVLIMPDGEEVLLPEGKSNYRCNMNRDLNKI